MQNNLFSLQNFIHMIYNFFKIKSDAIFYAMAASSLYGSQSVCSFIFIQVSAAPLLYAGAASSVYVTIFMFRFQQLLSIYAVAAISIYETVSMFRFQQLLYFMLWLPAASMAAGVYVAVYMEWSPKFSCADDQSKNNQHQDFDGSCYR